MLEEADLHNLRLPEANCDPNDGLRSPKEAGLDLGSQFYEVCHLDRSTLERKNRNMEISTRKCYTREADTVLMRQELEFKTDPLATPRFLLDHAHSKYAVILSRHRYRIIEEVRHAQRHRSHNPAAK